MLALCGLAAKSTTGAPDLARGLYQEVWKLARDLAEPQGAVLAARLRQEAGSADPAVRCRELAMASRLEELGRWAWPLTVVAEGAQALAQGLAQACQNPDPPLANMTWEA